MWAKIFTLFSLLGPLMASAQIADVYVWEATTAVNYMLNNDWSMNTSIATRTSWPGGSRQGEEGAGGSLTFAEINHFVTYRINPVFKVSLGYKHRRLAPIEATGLYEHRTTQQVAILHTTRVIRLASRLRSEQRFDNQSFRQRLRYRLSVDFPLSGESLDHREFYLMASDEVTYEIRIDSPNPWGNRLSTGIGYLFGEITKLQLGLTYRSENFTRQTVSRLFLESALFINLKSKP